MANLIGQTLLGRYRLDDGPWQGGMADVYKAWDPDRNQYLALKVLHENLALDQEIIHRFQKEATRLESLKHRSIVRFYEFEQDGLLAFILMEFIDGPTLQKKIFLAASQQKPFSLNRVLELMRPICSALHFAHRRKLVHCDIKPANILIDNTECVYVSDFGIARMTESAATTTILGVQGTPHYMAPEQARGEPPTPQTDIYALGIVLYEMLTGGTRPFMGEHAQKTGSINEKILWEHINLRPPSIRMHNPKVPPAVEAVVMKCLEKVPGERHSSVLELLGALEWVIEGKQPIPTAEEIARRKKEEEARLLDEEETQRKKKEEEAKLLAEAEAKRREEEEARLKAQEEARRKVEAAAQMLSSIQPAEEELPSQPTVLDELGDEQTVLQEPEGEKTVLEELTDKQIVVEEPFEARSVLPGILTAVPISESELTIDTGAISKPIFPPKQPVREKQSGKQPELPIKTLIGVGMAGFIIILGGLFLVFGVGPLISAVNKLIPALTIAPIAVATNPPFQVAINTPTHVASNTPTNVAVTTPTNVATNAPTQQVRVGPGFDVIFVVDATQNVNKPINVTGGKSTTYLDRMNEIMLSFIEDMKAADQVGFHVVTGDNAGYKIVPLTANKEDLINQILPGIINDLKNIQQTGSPSTGVEGAKNALSQFPATSGTDIQRVIVVLTTKFPQWDADPNLKELVDQAINNHVIINAVLVNVVRSELGPPPKAGESAQSSISLRAPLNILATQTGGIELWGSAAMDSQWQALIKTFNDWFIGKRGS